MSNELQMVGNGDVFRLFLEADNPENGELTIKASRQEASRFLEFVKNHNVGLADGLAEYVKSLEERGLSAKTRNKIVSLVRKRIKLALEKHKDHLDKAKLYDFEKALNGVKQKKIADKEKAVTEDRILSKDEIERLIDGLRNGSSERIISSPRKIALLVELLNKTGVRITEALEIKLTQMKRPRGAEYFQVEIEGKGNKSRTVDVITELIKRIREEFKGTRYLFEYGNEKRYNRSYVSDQIAKAGLLILGRHISAHTLRHSWATRKLKEGKSLKAVSRYLGHSSTAITADLYIHDDLKWDDVKE